MAQDCLSGPSCANTRDAPDGSIGPSLGTKRGTQQAAEMEVRASENPGCLLSVLHLRYEAQENIERLQVP